MTACVFGRGDSNAIFIGNFTVDRAVSDGLSASSDSSSSTVSLSSLGCEWEGEGLRFSLILDRPIGPSEMQVLSDLLFHGKMSTPAAVLVLVLAQLLSTPLY